MKNCKKLWLDFAEIPIDAEDAIEQGFEHFPIGTHRQEIWHWFEENFNVRVYDLMQGENND